MLIFSYYIDNEMDRAWFDSSNIVYGECDESDTQYKTVRIVFKNGSQYQYEDVLVSDWVSFKRADSQGKALNEKFKKAGYKYKRIEDANLDEIVKELSKRNDYDINMSVSNGEIVFIGKEGNELYRMDIMNTPIPDGIKGLLEALSFKVNYNKDGE